jgi:hypothetical protein
MGYAERFFLQFTLCRQLCVDDLDFFPWRYNLCFKSAYTRCKFIYIMVGTFCDVTETQTAHMTLNLCSPSGRHKMHSPVLKPFSYYVRLWTMKRDFISCDT